ncbi:nicotinate-nucleotide--dimethylbenzimidazole phosphoribosyltransferase [Anaerocolumna aminovalerica]|uniref:Nicotinate-nucleotide--dimethylbenzimidazole phosphoribosyltransferase n=1 Tax=Anaerocolumna aminovalerica TaxID=1527 RepID=A0A1I5FD88_9FIRM|nr:nicotinate-nucleotide--dimethylbenzimidazole phosphoribosyltransferase [Anaerocolumna aminovalerica]SFO21702.1 nicotinate-nucleotide-dimethylbenzimidazole phosphoribosyltransferase [Anaerocolumna aminovalerica]
MNYKDALKIIEPPDKEAIALCKKRWDSIAKPLHSLGKLEDGIIQIAGIAGKEQIDLDKKALVIMCADNGVVEEGVTQSSSQVTAIVSENFIDMNSCACIMAKQIGAAVFPIDMGINRDTKLPNNKKIAYGTNNILYGPAMTRQQAIQAIEVGIDTVFELKEKGYNIIATGEMGIGNTTTSSAVTSVLLDLPVEMVTGKGAGLSNAGLERKIEVIRKAIERNKPHKDDPIDVLSKLGGYDIAGLAGVFIGGAAARIPVVIDGFITLAAALIAIGIEPKVYDFIMPSHVSKENGGKILLNAIGMQPYITCDMCLGEGTGAITLFPLLDMSLAVYKQMSTFDQIKIDAYQPLK